MFVGRFPRDFCRHEQDGALQHPMPRGLEDDVLELLRGEDDALELLRGEISIFLMFVDFDVCSEVGAEK